MSENPPSESLDITEKLTTLEPIFKPMGFIERQRLIGPIYDAFMSNGGDKQAFVDIATTALKTRRDKIASLLNMYIRSQEASHLPTQVLVSRNETFDVLSSARKPPENTKIPLNISVIPTATTKKLEILKEQWGSLEINEIIKILAEAYDSFSPHAGELTKEFIDIAVEVLNQDITTIRLFLETYLRLGERAFQAPPANDANTTIANTAAVRFLLSRDAAIASDVLDERDLSHVANVVGRLSVNTNATKQNDKAPNNPTALKKPGKKPDVLEINRPADIKELRRILSKKGNLGQAEAQKLYSNLQKEWSNFSHTERAKILKKLLYFQVDWNHTVDKAIAFNDFHAKISFLTKEEIMGYIEVDKISYNVDLKDRPEHDARNNRMLDTKAVSAIGSLRLEFDDVFGNIQFDEEILKIQQDTNNLTPGGRLKSSAFLLIRKKLEEMKRKKHSFQPGIKYAINLTPDHKTTEARTRYEKILELYGGIDDEEFELVSPSDPEYAIKHEQLRTSDERRNPNVLLFKGARNRYFFIDFRIVFSLAEIQEGNRRSSAATYGFRSEESEDDSEEKIEQPKKVIKKKPAQKKKRK